MFIQPNAGMGLPRGFPGAFEVAEAFSRFGTLLMDGVGGRYGRRDYAREGLVFRVDVPAGYYMAEVGVPDGPECAVATGLCEWRFCGAYSG